MASLVYVFPATIPAGSTALVNHRFDPAVVERIVITVPPGPSGLVGFQLWVQGGQCQPARLGQYFVADDRIIELVLHGLPDSGAWQVVGYNTDIYDHTIVVEYYVTPVAVAAASSASEASAPVDESVLGLAGDTQLPPPGQVPGEGLPPAPPAESVPSGKAGGGGTGPPVIPLQGG